ncbi:putative low-affinity inorganic phosphate transporter [Methanocaldococcus lauensis]|uniref:Putative low-affinity inorganic phosphate transporter n=1 Tax=Methanocaldococcus lauensis TaxID=2546128 RepID=A0A8D6PW58_9EURY|nr:inorganic phosphate transporter [Methanocaldococcus lauensis]CAB3288463.1 putative low-affinity inorganic phosphate transporter [Methanocaldococcus lauensis]
MFILGANNVGNAIGTAYASKAASYKSLLILFSVSVIVGSLFAKNVGNTVNSISSEALISLIISSLVMTISTYKKVPISLHTIIVCSLIGLNFSSSNLKVFFKILLSWIFSPTIAVIIAYIFYLTYERIKIPIFKKLSIIRTLLLLTSGIIAFNLGSNDLPTILGTFTTSQTIYLIGAVFLCLGAYLYGNKISETFTMITNLSVTSAFIAQLSGGLAVTIFTALGMPVSTTQAIVGGILGVGLTKGIKTIKWSVFKKIIFWWVVAPIIALIIGFIIKKKLM